MKTEQNLENRIIASTRLFIIIKIDIDYNSLNKKGVFMCETICIVSHIKTFPKL